MLLSNIRRCESLKPRGLVSAANGESTWRTAQPYQLLTSVMALRSCRSSCLTVGTSLHASYHWLLRLRNKESSSCLLRDQRLAFCILREPHQALIVACGMLYLQHTWLGLTLNITGWNKIILSRQHTICGILLFIHPQNPSLWIPLTSWMHCKFKLHNSYDSISS